MVLKTKNGFCYNPILESKINSLKFDYVAMGHIHKNNINGNDNILYPGSTISFGFDEPGEHGMVVGEIKNKYLITKFVRLDDRRFEKYELSITNVFSLEELIEKISNINLYEKNLYEIVLVGNRNFEINTREIIKLIENKNVLKIKDNTELAINIEELSKENNLRGIFIREVIKMYQTGFYTEEEVKKAIELGLSVM